MPMRSGLYHDLPVRGNERDNPAVRESQRQGFEVIRL
jgi:hypothetical protein